MSLWLTSIQTTAQWTRTCARSQWVSVPGAPLRATFSNARGRFAPSEISDGVNGTLHVWLTRGMFAVVDAADLHLVAGRQWRVTESAHSKMYAATGQSPKILMHRLILGVTSGSFVDHINGNTLDNRRCNLRLATAYQNRANAGKIKTPTSSKYRGVSWKKREQRWQAQITNKGRIRWLGYFLTEEAAARAYDAVFREIHGDFARLNFPEAT